MRMYEIKSAKIPTVQVGNSKSSCLAPQVTADLERAQIDLSTDITMHHHVALHILNQHSHLSLSLCNSVDVFKFTLQKHSCFYYSTITGFGPAGHHQVYKL
jgi:hypothetical protein